MSWLFSSSCLREDVMMRFTLSEFPVPTRAIWILGDFPPRARVDGFVPRTRHVKLRIFTLHSIPGAPNW